MAEPRWIEGPPKGPGLHLLHGAMIDGRTFEDVDVYRIGMVKERFDVVLEGREFREINHELCAWCEGDLLPGGLDWVTHHIRISPPDSPAPRPPGAGTPAAPPGATRRRRPRRRRA
jgi:hypothetical protein